MSSDAYTAQKLQDIVDFVMETPDNGSEYVQWILDQVLRRALGKEEHTTFIKNHTRPIWDEKELKWVPSGYWEVGEEM